MADKENDAFFAAKPAEVVVGRVILTPDGPQPYKVTFRVGDRVLSEQPVATVREGEVIIRRELAFIQFSAQQERPNPEAPPKRLSAVEPSETR